MTCISIIRSNQGYINPTTINVTSFLWWDWFTFLGYFFLFFVTDWFVYLLQAWIRLALNDGLIVSYIDAILADILHLRLVVCDF